MASVDDPARQGTGFGPKLRSRKDGAAVHARRPGQAPAQPHAGQLSDRPRPYQHVAARAGVTEDEVLARVARLLDERIIRQVTPIFDTRAFGYQSMLVAAKVDPDNPWRAASVINEHPGVSHNYLRNHEFNIWFTIATEPDSPLGLERHARRARPPRRRRVDPPAADAEAVQDPDGPRDGGAGPTSSPIRPPRRSRRPRPSASPMTTSIAPSMRATAGRSAGRLRAVHARGAPSSGSPRSSCSRISSGCRSAGCCAAWRRSSSTAAPASAPTAWGSGRCPRTGSSSSAAGWPRSAASRTAISARPTPTGRTRSSRWRTAAPRRSATRSSTRSPTQTGIDERATLYSSTEFKKIRLLYFTDEYRHWEREHAGGVSDGAGVHDRSLGRALPRAPCRSCPGGVNSPVRAMRADRPRPDLHRLGGGLADPRRRRQRATSIGSARGGRSILGHADPDVITAVARARAAHGTTLRRADRG